MPRLTYQSHPLKTDRPTIEVAEGTTVREALADLDPRWGTPLVAVGLDPVDMDYVLRGDDHAVANLPVEAGAALSTIASALIPVGAASVAGAAFAVGTLGYSVTMAAVSVVGALALNSLIAPPEQRDQEAFEDRPILTGAVSQIRKFGVFPYIVGKRQIVMPMTATGFTINDDDESIYVGRYTLGYGPMAVDDLLIGPTSLSAFDDVEIEFLNVDPDLSQIPTTIRDKVVGWRQGSEPMSLYPSDITQDSYNFTFEGTGDSAVRATRPGTVSASFDLVYARGLYNNKGAKGLIAEESSYQYRFRALGATTWGDWTVQTFTDKKTYPFTRSHEIVFPSAGEWEVEIRRNSIARDGGDMTNFTLTALRSVSGDPLPSHPEIAEVAVKIRASGQLNGQIDALSAVAHRLAPIWTGTGWTAPARTRHPAWALAHALRGDHLDEPTLDSRIDLAGLKAWADTEPHWTCDYVEDRDGQLEDLLKLIAAAGRARYANRDMIETVIRDEALGPVRDVLSARDVHGFKGTYVFPRQIHAFRVSVWNATTNQADEIVVYNEGFDASNSSVYETLELPGVVVESGEDQGNAYRLAIYHIRQTYLRPEVFSWEMDFRHLRVHRGHKIELNHDVPGFGVGSARIRSIGIGEIELDDEFENLGTTEYILTIPLFTGEFRRVRAVYEGGFWRRRGGDEFTDAEVGNNVSIHRVDREAVEVIITNIEALGEERARLSAVAASPAVLAEGPIPLYNPGGVVREPTTGIPPAPVILEARSGRGIAIQETDGSLTPRAAVVVARPVVASNLRVRIRWREAPSGAWVYGTIKEIGAVLVTGRLEIGTLYDLQAQFIRGSLASKWSEPPRQVTASVREVEEALTVPPGWGPILGVDEIDLVGEEYPHANFAYFRFWGSTNTDTQLFPLGTRVRPAFNYRGPYRRFRVSAVMHDGAESPMTAYISASPRGVTRFDLAAEIQNEIDTANTIAQSVRDDHDARFEGFVGTVDAAIELAKDDARTSLEQISLVSGSGTNLVLDSRLSRTNVGDYWVANRSTELTRFVSTASNLPFPNTLRARATDTANGTPDIRYKEKKIYSAAGRTFELSAWVRATRACQVRLISRGTTSGGAFSRFYQTDYRNLAANSWVKIDARVTIDANEHSLFEPFVLQFSGLQDGDYYYCCDPSISDVTEGEQIRATLDVNYLTSDQTNQAISAVDTRLTTSIGDLSSEVTTTQGSLTDLEQSYATFSSQIQSSVDGNTASVTQLQSTTADINGNLEGFAGLRVQAGGAVSLLDLGALDGSTGTYSFVKIDADKILLNGTVVGDHFKVKTLTADKIVSRGINVPGVAGSGDVRNNSSTWTVVAEFNLVLDYPADVQGVLAASLVVTPSFLPTLFELQVLVGGTLVTQYNQSSFAFMQDDLFRLTANFTKQNQPAGTVNVQFRMRNMGGNGVRNCNLSASGSMA